MVHASGCMFVSMVPVEVINEYIAPHLTVFDLRALDSAFTNKHLRPRFKDILKSINYACADCAKMRLCDVKWLHERGVTITNLYLSIRDNEAAIHQAVTYICTHINTLRHFKLLDSCEELKFNSILEQLAYGCPQLEVLHIPLADDISVGIAALGQQCRNLHSISLPGNSICDADIRTMCSSCPNLQHIDISFSLSLTDASLIAIANTYPHLQSISISISVLCSNFTDDGIMYFADKCHELRSVSVSCDDITSRGLTTLWAANPNLIDVYNSHNYFMSDDDIIQLAQCCPLLQKLNLCRCEKITDAAVIAVAEHCPQLRSLNISYCKDVSDASLIALGQHCHDLKSIDISSLENISDVGIAALAAGCPLLQEFTAYDSYISDSGVVALARGCRDLRKMDVRAMPIGLETMCAIAGNCPLISELSISGCQQASDAWLYVIAQHCHNLTYLDASYCKHLQADAINAVLVSCSQLTFIDGHSIRILLKKYPFHVNSTS